ncbi:MAG: methyl-accepting chemotaxis protein [Burkholderiaceae bacterium]|nr:methyl-accepting chemotaxis protein [Burkholderiaceae bacterium]
MKGNAMSWLHRMRLSHKFVVLGVLAMAMIALPTSLYLLRTADEVGTAERRVDGVASAIALQKVIRLAQNHRDVVAASLGTAASLSALWQSDNEALSSLQPAARSALIEALAAFETRFEQAPVSTGFVARWKEARERWDGLDRQLAAGELKSAERSTQLHSEWIASLLSLSEDMIDEFGLTLAPERDSNALVDASLVHMPWAAEMLGRMRAFGTQALVEKNLSYGGRAELAAMKQRLNERLAEVDRSLARAYATDSKHSTRLGASVAAMKTKLSASLGVIDQRLVAAQQLDLPSNEYYEGLTGTIDSLYAFEEAATGSLAALFDARVSELRRTAFAVVGALAAIVGLSFALMVVFVRSLTIPLAEAVSLARSIADGDLNVTLQSRGRNEVGQLVDALVEMRDRLVDVVGDVRRHAEGVAAASAQIAQGNSYLSSRTEQQASALEETAASMEELSATVKQNADNAHQADELARGASEVAVSGGEVVGQVVDTMKEINESSRRIADIINVIDGIAFQTNILALNAAVEAARAGEQGRGFAVVAGEVRSLAQRSAEAAREIKTLIGASVERVERGTKLVDRAGSTMREIVSSIRRVTEIMGEISTASAEQSTGVAQVGSAVGQMDQATQHNAALVEESAAAAASLEGQAQDLLRATAVFRLAGDARPGDGLPASDASGDVFDAGASPDVSAVGVERRGANRARNVSRLPMRAAFPADEAAAHVHAADGEAPRALRA